MVVGQIDQAAKDVLVWDDFDKGSRLVSHQRKPAVILTKGGNGESGRPSVVY